MTSLISPITMPQDVQLKIFSNLKPREYLPLMEVCSTWNQAIKEVLKKRLWLNYIPFGEELDTYQDHDCVGSTKELKGRIRLFIKQLVAEKKRGVFICFFPLTDSSDHNSPWLAIKWNPQNLEYSSDPIPMDKDFDPSSLQAVLPYIKGQKFSEDTPKLAIRVCLAVRKLAKDKVLTPFGSTALGLELDSKLIKQIKLDDITLGFYTGISPQEIHARLLGEVQDLFYRRTFDAAQEKCKIALGFLGLTAVGVISLFTENELTRGIAAFLMVSLVASLVVIIVSACFAKKKL